MRIADKIANIILEDNIDKNPFIEATGKSILIRRNPNCPIPYLSIDLQKITGSHNYIGIVFCTEIRFEFYSYFFKISATYEIHGYQELVFSSNIFKENINI